MDRSFNGEALSGAGPGRPLKPLPKSAAALGAGNRTAGRHRRGRVPASATTYRMPMTPPVCGASPGRLLELQTSLGLLQAKNILEWTARSRDSHMHHQQLSSSLPSKGFLKSGRLQPLGVVDTPPLDANQCLGIISAGEREKGMERPQRRYRSSTMPGLGTNSNGQCAGRREVLIIERDLHMVEEKRTRKQRSYSAVPRSFDSSEFAHSMSASKPLALVPQRASDESSVVLSEERRRTSQPTHSTPHSLPPVVPPEQRKHQEGEMRVEVKAIRKAKHNSDSLGGEGITDQNGTLSPKLPHIPLSSSAHTTHTSPLELRKNRTPDDTGGGDEAGKGKTDDERERRGKKVNMVVVGTVMEKKGGKGSRRQRHSGNRIGKLSFGWSQPQPLDRLTGHSVVSPNGPKRGGEGRGEREKGRENELVGGEKHSTHTTKETIVIGR